MISFALITFFLSLLLLVAVRCSFSRRSSTSSSSRHISSSFRHSATVLVASPATSTRFGYAYRPASTAAGLFACEKRSNLSTSSGSSQQQSQQVPVPDCNGLSDSMAKLTTKVWIPHTDRPVVKPSLEVDAIFSAFSGFSTYDKPLEKSPIIDELAACFGGLSALDKSSEKVTNDMMGTINAFGGIWNKERSQHSEVPRPCPEVDELAACFSNLSVQEPRLRSCFKTKGHRPVKKVSFVTYVREDVDLCGLRFFEVEEGTQLHRHKRGSNVPHNVGAKFAAAASDGSYQLVKAIGVNSQTSNLSKPLFRRGSS